MVQYECNLCNYTTTRCSNFEKHEITRKHLINFNRKNDEIIKEVLI